jgi:hypothetical protein
VVILDVSKCLQRGLSLFRTKKDIIVLDEVKEINLPLNLSVSSIQNKYTVLVTDGDNFNQIINKQEIKFIIPTLEYIAINYNKIKKYYEK